MDGETSGLVRGMNLATSLSVTDRLALRVALVAVILSALTVAWANTTRTTTAPTGAVPAVFRENLITGAAEFCLLGPGGVMHCLPRNTLNE